MITRVGDTNNNWLTDERIKTLVEKIDVLSLAGSFLSELKSGEISRTDFSHVFFSGKSPRKNNIVSGQFLQLHACKYTQPWSLTAKAPENEATGIQKTSCWGPLLCKFSRANSFNFGRRSTTTSIRHPWQQPFGRNYKKLWWRGKNPPWNLPSAFKKRSAPR